MKVKLCFDEIFKKSGLNQKQLAEKTGLRPNTISNLNRGYIDRLSLEHVEIIATALNVKDISELIKLIPDDDVD